MKILVDSLPNTCGECQFCADVMMMTAVGVPKQTTLCTVQATLIPPDNPQEPPKTIDKEKTPISNGCIFQSKNGGNAGIIL